MDSVKGFFTSKAIWGSIISVAATVLPMLGISFTAADGAEVSGWIEQIIAIAGAAFAMYGRVVAKKQIAGVV